MPRPSTRACSGFRGSRSHRISRHAAGVGSSPTRRVHLGVEEGFSPARKAHPALLVADLEALRLRLQGAGVVVVDDEPLPGFDRFYAYDPFGNRVELLSPLMRE